MKSIKQLFASALALTCALSLAACGGSAAPASSSAPAPAPSTAEEASAPVDATASATVSSGDAVTIKVGASPAPHAEILESIKPALAAEGVNLEIVEFTDYVIPNMALDEGDIDANYFQHYPYLADFNEKNGTDLVSAGAIHFEPLGIYPGKTASIEALADGATIAIPNDATNEARALLLLEKLGLIKLADGVGLSATPLDITENTKNIKFEEIEAAQVPNVLPDVDLAVINGNYALGAGLAGKVLTTEDKDSEAAQEFANIVAVRTGDESRPEIQKLIAALQSDETAAFINEKYNGTVIPVF
ncbi:MetQ/NlpA family ABC transporter substrate-binding protein [Anaerotruncus colihominis]|uniref:Lipoprotein n=1 Tax=Anaerotruncus colihominis TaxID=169435 RepID=A0A845RN86_9FIRM|nr:MetQ/NlpA family ABC transporter substrate-binding protein [Anaerotruncus colihominis]MCR2026209.1 MetQ/NlpA family ABC transporter substrate-binding protein [Anaerotruncus colihominis]NBI80251.1 ABC transporter substrate-binding protein [Anaerotruncus colihominis]NDO40686.1 ABC transporter substrate-binding protein [Anaerotruncus colihominis]